MNNLGTLNRALVDAVHARMELDLRIGAAFTRLLTLKLRGFEELSNKIISYGSCQFPTLGFVVDQYRRVQEFVPERFWKLELVLRKDGRLVEFNWARNHLFDQRLCAILYEKCMENPVATVASVISKPTSK